MFVYFEFFVILFISSFTAALISVLFWLDGDIESNGGQKPLLLTIPFGLMVIWTAILCVIPPTYDKVKESQVYRVENIDAVVLNNELVNLNEEFGRSFDEGEKILVHKKESRVYAGVYYKFDNWELLKDERSEPETDL